ncbi:HNH endonuclease [Mycobacterium sp. TJFP1]|uniref:HNH endonuclease n=1 Tax=Mycolicibacterium austroafricanum TaxID=39687 RepID=UPI0033BE906D
MKLCDIDGCERPARSQSAALCGTHYTRWIRYGAAVAPAPAPRKKRLCIHCGSVVTSGKATTKYCSDCAKKRVWNANPRRPRRGVVETECTYCAAVIRDLQWRNRKCCDECAKSRDWSRTGLKATATCVSCGKEARRGAPRKTDQDYMCRECRRKRPSTPRSVGGHLARARLYKAEYEPVDKMRVFERDGWKCGICGEAVDKDLAWPHRASASLDHVVPLSQGGAHTYSNTRCSHLSCNTQRGNRSA